MALSKWWLNLNRKFLERILLMARNDPDISFKDYNQMQKLYNELYKGK